MYFPVYSFISQYVERSLNVCSPKRIPEKRVQRYAITPFNPNFYQSFFYHRPQECFMTLIISTKNMIFFFNESVTSTTRRWKNRPASRTFHFKMIFIRISERGLSRLFVDTFCILSTTSIPSTTSPKTVYAPSR